MPVALLIGSTGQLGSDLHRVLEQDGLSVLTPSRETLDVTDHSMVRRFIEEHRPAVVYNTSAYLRVDDCEDEHELAWSVNAYAVRNLAEACRDAEATLVHFSTDYVFGGDLAQRTPCRETDTPMPVNVYGITKLSGEHAVRAYCPDHLIVRSAGLYGLAGSRLKGGNFVETMLRVGRERDELRVVDDQHLTPTFTRDLAAATDNAVAAGARGTLHITNAGSCSWHEFACAIFELAGIDVTVRPIPSSEYPTKARRPAYSVMSNARLIQLGVSEPRPWKDALASFLEERAGRSASDEH